MAATSGQGRSFATFLVGLTVACGGIAYLSTGLGKVALAVGVVIFIAPGRLALNAVARVARIGRVEPQARRTSHGGL